jgi:hypothetical protein
VFLGVTLVTMYDLYLMQPVLYYQENIPLAMVTLFQEKTFFIEFIMVVYYEYLRVLVLVNILHLCIQI